MNTISKEQLTAYALNELSESERAELEALLVASEEDQQYAAGTKEFCNLLQSSIGSKEGTGLTQEQKEEIANTLPFAATAPRKRWPVIVFGASAAAAVAVMLSKPYFEKDKAAASVAAKPDESRSAKWMEQQLALQDQRVEEKRVAMLELQKKYDIVDFDSLQSVINSTSGSVENSSEVTIKQARSRSAEYQEELGKLKAVAASTPPGDDKKALETRLEIATKSLDSLRRKNESDQSLLVLDKAKHSDYLMAKRDYEQQVALQQSMKEQVGADYFLASKDHTRGHILRQVDEPWESAVPNAKNAPQPSAEPSLDLSMVEAVKEQQFGSNAPSAGATTPAQSKPVPGYVAKAPSSRLGVGAETAARGTTLSDSQAQTTPTDISGFALPSDSRSLASAAGPKSKSEQLGKGVGTGYGRIPVERSKEAAPRGAVAMADASVAPITPTTPLSPSIPEARFQYEVPKVPGRLGIVPVELSANIVESKKSLSEDLPSVKLVQEAEQPVAPGSESYFAVVENPFKTVAAEPLSTFSIDVDTASYANVRRFLNMGQRPPADAVRLEELVNYFRYDYPKPEAGKPCSITAELVNCPWNEAHRLARIGLKARVDEKRPQANLVFLLDVSGSMNEANKLPLVKQSLKLLVEKLAENDRVSIVVYAGASGLVLPPTSGADKKTIVGAIDNLQPGGSTNGASGITLAYEEARKGFIKEGVNRVILATDGDFNVGISDRGGLQTLIEKEAKSGVFLSVLGYGMGNLKDSTMEVLADKGNGNYAYIDSLGEARKVLAEEMSSTLVTVAKDVKLQIEFNPSKVRSYKLLGYENRMLAKEDFNDDKKDAGEMGAGQTVTALYEIVPSDAPLEVPAVDKLKYQSAAVDAPAAAAAPATPVVDSPETMTVKLRYKAPDADVSQLMELPVTDQKKALAEAPKDFKFATSVAGYAMLLKGNKNIGTLNWEMVRSMAREGKGEDAEGYRGEFLQLVEKAAGVAP